MKRVGVAEFVTHQRALAPHAQRAERAEQSFLARCLSSPDPTHRKLLEEAALQVLYKTGLGCNGIDVWHLLPIDVMGVIIKHTLGVSFTTWCLLSKRTARAAMRYYCFPMLRETKDHTTFMAHTFTDHVLKIRGEGEMYPWELYGMTLPSYIAHHMQNGSMVKERVAACIVDQYKDMTPYRETRYCPLLELINGLTKYLSPSASVHFARVWISFENPIRDAQQVVDHMRMLESVSFEEGKLVLNPYVGLLEEQLPELRPIGGELEWNVATYDESMLGRVYAKYRRIATREYGIFMPEFVFDAEKTEEAKKKKKKKEEKEAIAKAAVAVVFDTEEARPAAGAPRMGGLGLWDNFFGGGREAPAENRIGLQHYTRYMRAIVLEPRPPAYDPSPDVIEQMEEVD